MKRIGIFAAAVVMVGVSVTGCATGGEPPTRFPVVSDYGFLASKDFTVVGAVVVRNVQQHTLIADLMDAAIAIGGHDIMNIRVDWRTIAGRTEINSATAVVIRFTDETLVEETTVTQVNNGGVITTTTTTSRFVRRDPAGSGAVAGGDTGGGRRFGRR